LSQTLPQALILAALSEAESHEPVEGAKGLPPLY